ncbi:hypothetical protein NDU88_004122, partial [Pleurodeles waltl]
DHTIHAIPVGVTVAHEMGHNLGMLHDTKQCVCSDSTCIMSPSKSKITPKLFSNCSFKYFQDFITKHMPTCLMNKPEGKDLITLPECGNGIVEAGEQCDCGLKE